MREEALQVARNAAGPGDKMNRLREYLQAFILRSLHESGAFASLAFVGGTALRFLYDLPRFSEDLDFSLHSASGAPGAESSASGLHGDMAYNFEEWMAKLKRDMAFADLESTVAVKMEKTVHSAWIRTPRLLYEAGLSDQAEQKLAIKIEVDSCPPGGAGFETRVVNRTFLFALRHYDLPSLMAGKLHALLTRGYPKGRDYYDLLWYLTKTPAVEPNLILLDTALKQTEKSPPQALEWKSFLLKKFDQVDWPKIVGDVERFLERPNEIHLVTRENLSALVMKKTV